MTKFRLAPKMLTQSILPWFQGARFDFMNFELGSTPHPEVEQAVLDEVGSYGSQLGHIGDALEVLLNHVDLGTLTDKEKDIVSILRGELAHVRQVKARVLNAPA